MFLRIYFYATKMPLLLITLLLCSCSPKQTDNNAVRYSDMSAAEDAGKTPSK